MQLRGHNPTANAIAFANSTDTPYSVNVAHQAVSPQGNYLTGEAQTSSAQAVAKIFARGSDFAWFGQGYAGSNITASANFCWPAYQGNRNSNNDTNYANVSAAYPAPGNPTSCS